MKATLPAPPTPVTTVLGAPRMPTGTGPTIPAPPPIPDDDRCDDCGGSGVRSFQTEWRGSVQDGEVECPTCNGSGKWCPECQNTGLVVEGVYGGKVVYVSGCPECGREGER